jgi:hypothetical protein
LGLYRLRKKAKLFHLEGARVLQGICFLFNASKKQIPRSARDDTAEKAFFPPPV